MNENCMHSSLGAFIETLRKMRKITIAELALEAHISTKKSGSPTKVLMKDRFVQLCIIGWILTFILILYC